MRRANVGLQVMALVVLSALTVVGQVSQAPKIDGFQLNGEQWTCTADGKPLSGMLLKPEGSLWPFHIEMSGTGDISFLRRRPVPGMEREIVMAENMAGKSLSIKVRANGEDYEVYQKAPLDAGPWKLVTKGSFAKAKDSKISFRWGMYCSSKKGQSVPNDALLFVAGAAIR